MPPLHDIRTKLLGLVWALFIHKLLSALLLTTTAIVWTALEYKTKRTHQPYQGRRWLVFAGWLGVFIWHVAARCFKLYKKRQAWRAWRARNNILNGEPCKRYRSPAGYIILFAQAALALLATSMAFVHYGHTTVESAWEPLWVSVPLVFSLVAVTKVNEPPTLTTMFRYDRDIEMGLRGGNTGQQGASATADAAG